MRRLKSCYENKNMPKKHIWSAMALLSAVLFLTACANRPTPQERVKAVFDKHKDTICEMIQEYSTGDAGELEIDMEGVLHAYAMSVRGHDGRVLQFVCIAEGISPAGFVAGFYYSPDDEPLLIGFRLSGPSELAKDGDGYSWTDGTDNQYYTERMCENFYYYQEVN